MAPSSSQPKFRHWILSGVLAILPLIVAPALSRGDGFASVRFEPTLYRACALSCLCSVVVCISADVSRRRATADRARRAAWVALLWLSIASLYTCACLLLAVAAGRVFVCQDQLLGVEIVPRFGHVGQQCPGVRAISTPVFVTGSYSMAASRVKVPVVPFGVGIGVVFAISALLFGATPTFAGR